MIRLIDEVDPKRSNGKHMAGKQILIRDKEEIFMSKIVLVADIPYIYRWGIAYKLETFDGWSPLPVYNVDENLRHREMDRYFSVD